MQVLLNICHPLYASLSIGRLCAFLLNLYFTKTKSELFAPSLKFNDIVKVGWDVQFMVLQSL